MPYDSNKPSTEQGFFVGQRDVENSSMDFIECDVPYSVNFVALREAKGAEVSVKDYTEVDAKQYPNFINQVAQCCYRMLADHRFMIWWFGYAWSAEPSNPASQVGYELHYRALVNAGFKVGKMPGIWVKSRAAGLNLNYKLATGYDTFFIVSKGSPQIVKVGHSNVFTFAQSSNPPHPAARPIELYAEIISCFTRAGQRVGVPFMGSGNSALASANLGLFPIGWDIASVYRDKYLATIASQTYGSYTSY